MSFLLDEFFLEGYLAIADGILYKEDKKEEIGSLRSEDEAQKSVNAFPA